MSVPKWVEATEKLMEAFDRGVFIRKNMNDLHDTAWAIKLLPYLKALATLQEEAERARYEEQKPEDRET